MLGRKQSLSDQRTWEAAYRNAATLVQTAAFEDLLAQTVSQIRQTCQGKHVAFGWSGGKDSLVLQEVMALAGYTECVLVLTYLEYRAFLQWVTDHMPPDLTVLRTRHDLCWLRDHPHMLFPQTASTAAQWFHQVQHQGQQDYVRARKIDFLAVGRRRLDGNYCGRDGLYTNRAGITRYAPLVSWTHEEVFAALHYFGRTLPPCYGWPRGYQVGTGPWAARQWTCSLREAFDEVWQIDPEVVLEAARMLPSAAGYLAVRDMEALCADSLVLSG